ncbi:DUF481 domain-containing protein [Planctomycetota bacterium]|nr:DUF481 domain-containing protein [Planctomycetota bacterium]
MRALILMMLLILPVSLMVADKLTLINGETMIGSFKKFENGKVFFNSETAGDVEITAESIATIELENAIDIFVARTTDMTKQTTGKLTTRDGKLFLEEGSESSEVAFTDFVAMTLEQHDDRPEWNASLRAYVQYKEGNTETTTVGGRFDINRRTKSTVSRGYGEVTYTDNRNLLQDKVTQREFLLGASFSYVFDFKLAVDAFTDWRFNEFSGYRYKAVFGVGPSYYVIKEADTTVKTWAALTYNTEDNINGTEDRSYLGARVGVDTTDIFLDGSLRVEFHGWYGFDFEETKNMEAVAELMVDYKLASWLTTGVLGRWQWDNEPSVGFDRSDLTLRWTIGITWGGRWI